jgi:hypothetical protein
MQFERIRAELEAYDRTIIVVAANNARGETATIYVPTVNAHYLIKNRVKYRKVQFLRDAAQLMAAIVDLTRGGGGPAGVLIDLETADAHPELYIGPSG